MLTTKLSVNQSISGLVLIIGKRLMIISMAIHREQSIESIQLNKSNCLLGIHTYYIYLSQYLASDQSGASTQCLEIKHSLVLNRRRPKKREKIEKERERERREIARTTTEL